VNDWAVRVSDVVPHRRIATLTGIVPTAIIAFDFDPFLHIGDGVIRWETLGIAVAIFAALVLAGVGARAMDLRADDLLFVVLGVVPGAVVGGRLGYVLLHPAFFQAQPGAILDPAIGSLELGLGVVGGALTGGIVAALLDGSVGRWFHVAALPTIVALGAGKLAGILGGRGQGAPTGGDWATAYLGPGPWGSLGPEVPAHPSQLYEGIGTLAVCFVVMAVLAVPGLRRPDGRAFLIGIGLWALVRAVVGSTWRDPVVVGTLRAGQLIAIGIVILSFVGLVVLLIRERPRSTPAATG
jgi:phosphatidylglycerol:prolipoprotein diacylglycerol transferase